MVVAKTLQAQNQLVSQLQRREVKREYEAVVTGELVVVVLWINRLVDILETEK